MAGLELWTTARDRHMREAELRQSFEAVCLFSALGIVLSLLLLLTTGEAFDPGAIEEAFDPGVMDGLGGFPSRY